MLYESRADLMEKARLLRLRHHPLSDDLAARYEARAAAMKEPHSHRPRERNLAVARALIDATDGNTAATLHAWLEGNTTKKGAEAVTSTPQITTK